MLYEAYQKKINRIARILARIVRLLPLIIAALAVVISLIAGYAVIKGKVVSMTCLTEIVYGDSPECQTRALLSDVHYEHCAFGTEEWVDGLPDEAGHFRIRAVTRNIFGNPRYGKPAEITIFPKELSVGISDTEMIYGDGFALTGEVASGDRIVCGRYIYERTSSPSDAQYDVTPDTAYLRVLNENGKDVTSSYRITVQTASVKIEKLKITVTVPDASKVFDGEALTSERVEVTQGSLCNGDRLEGTFTDSITHAGTVNNEPTFRLWNDTGDDVTEYYDLTCNYGKLTVEKKPVIISTGSAQALYNGEAVSNVSYTVDTAHALIHGHTLTLAKGDFSFTNAGEHQNILNFQIKDAAGTDQTANYDLQIAAGVIQIDPRPLHVTTGSAEWVYDGQKHTANDYGSEGLLAGHTLDVLLGLEAIDVGEYKNEILFVVLDENGDDVTNNYDIVGSYGTCRITLRPLTFVTGSLETVYNGLPQTPDSFYQEGLVDVHGVQILSRTVETEANVYTNVMEFVIRDKSGRDVTFNYDITRVFGTLTIKPRPLYLTTFDQSWIYDGKEHNHPSYEASGLAEGDETMFLEAVGIRDAGSKINEVRVAVLSAESEVVTHNYEIAASFGTLTVTPRPITIRTDGGTWVYDSTVHGVSSYSVISELGIAEGERLTIDALYVTDVIRTENKPREFDIVRTSDFINKPSSLANYEITWEYGILEVLPRSISLKPADRSKIYDGEPLFAVEWEYTADTAYKLVPWHSIHLTYGGERTEAGRAFSSITDIRITDSTQNEKDVTSNYRIVLEKGVLEILPKPTSVDPEIPEGGSSGEGAGDGGGTSGGVLPDHDFSDIRDSSGSGEGDGEPFVVGEIMADSTGVLYLRLRSYGDFIGGIWTAGPSYEKLLPGGYNCNYLTSAALKNSGLTAMNASFRNMLITVLPYYLSLDGGVYVKPTGDVANIPLSDSYSVGYYAPSAGFSFTSLAGKLGEYAAYEEMYALEVYRNYLSVDSETRAYMEGVIAKEGFDLSDPYVIKKVAAYIRQSATYSQSYDKAMDKEDNIVIAFLENYKEGVCRHYATAAVLLYRALGIPARYVTGYMAETVADEYVAITDKQAHAWVEVYIDGIGWVQTDVTGIALNGGMGDGSGIGGSGNDSEPKEKMTLTIEPNYQSKVYDGSALLPDASDLKGNALLVKLLSEGYTFEASVSGSQTAVGQSESVIESFRLFDENGYDVTSLYEIEWKTGVLKVFPRESSVIRVYLYQLQKYYDGTALTLGQNDLEIVELPEGASLSLTLNIALTDVGYLSLSDLNGEIEQYISFCVTENGADASDRYLLEFVELDGSDFSYMPIRIDPRRIELTAGSAEKVYDGLDLTCGDVFVSLGSLAEGHWLKAETSGSNVDPGSEENEIVSVRIFDENNKDVTENYDISKKNGTLTVHYPQS